MKKLSAFLCTPARLMVMVGLIILVGEFSIMLLIGVVDSIAKSKVSNIFWEFIDPIVLTTLVSPALYILVFRPMRNQQAELERLLVESRHNEQLTAMVEAIPDAVFLKNGEGRWLVINEPAKQMFQLHDLPWQGKTEMELAELQPEFRAVHEGCLAGDEAAWQAGHLLVGEERVAGEDGQCAIIETRKVPIFSKEGQRKGLVVIGRDVTERRQAQEALLGSERHFRAYFERAMVGMSATGPEKGWMEVNEALCVMLGYSREELMHLTWAELTHPDDLATNEILFNRILSGEIDEYTMDKRFIRKDGALVYVHLATRAVRRADGSLDYMVALVEDISERKRSEQKLRLYGRVLDASVNSIAIVDAAQPDFPIVYINPAFTSITGYSAEEALGRNPRFLQGSDRDQPEIENVRSAVREKRNGQALLRNYRKDGTLFWNELYVSPVWGESGELTHFIGAARDITRRKTYEAELEHMANFDSLTGLPNRNLFHDRLSQAIIHAHRSSCHMAMAVIDLDGFNLINDSIGHHAGDLLLQEVAHRLSDCARAEDTVARLDGDEFVVIMSELAKEEDAVAIAEKLLRTFSVSMRCDMQDMYITASIGIAMYPRDGEDAESLFKHADLAMHSAKEHGRNRYQFYATDMNRCADECLGLSNDLHRALERNEFTLHYQPQADLRSGQITGAEALLRWQHLESGWVPPAKFIPVAEESGLIVPIGLWVLQQACLTAKTWHDQGFGITVAVNLSVWQLREPGFVQSVQDALHAAGLEARYLELELTEGVLIKQAEFIFDVLQQLREMGVELSIDDFGTGYSSLSYLKRFPISRLKIDQSFICDLVSNPDDAAIVGAIISLAHNLKLKVIAEGVETSEQQAFLRSRNCDEIQGYYFSKPLPSEDISTMLQQGKKIEPDIIAGAQAPAVLLVDDEENILSSLVRVLRRDGYRILKTTSAQEALGMLAVNEVGVIVSDQRMPEMNGVEFLRRAKQLHPDSMRIVLSGYTDLQSVTDAINEGAVYKFITKPWEDEQLRSQIREAFQHYEVKKERNSLMAQLAAANEDLSHAKQALEVQVDKKTLESMHNLDILRVSQEVLECLIVGVIGMDADGMIVVANKKVEKMLGVATMGSIAAECLPPALNELLQQTLGEGLGRFHCWKNPQGEEFTCWTHRMGASSQARGVVLVIISNVAQVI